METVIMAGTLVAVSAVVLAILGVTVLISYLAYRPWRKKSRGAGVAWGLVAFAGCCFGILPGIIAIGVSYVVSSID